MYRRHWMAASLVLAETSYTWKNVKPGPHTFAALLVDNDHTPIDGVDFTEVVAQAQVTVE